MGKKRRGGEIAREIYEEDRVIERVLERGRVKRGGEEMRRNGQDCGEGEQEGERGWDRYIDR